MANQPLKPFDGQLDPVDTPQLQPFSGVLDGEEPGLVARVKQGVSRTVDSARTALTDDPNEIAKIAAEQARNALPQTATQRQMAEEIVPYSDAASKAESVVDNVKAWGALGFKRTGQLLSNPGEAGKMIAEQLPNSLPGMAGAFAGGKAGAMLGTAVAPGLGTAIGGIGGALLGGFAGSYGLEKGASVLEQTQQKAQERGIDVRDEAATAKLLAQEYPEIEAAAQRKGVGTAGTDAVLNVATMGLAGLGGRTLAKEARTLAQGVKAGTINAADAATELARLEAANAARNTLKAQALRGTGVVGAEMVGDGASEAVGQKFAYGQVNPGEVVDEALLGLGSGGAMALGSKAFNKATGVVDQDATDQTLSALRQSVDAMGQPPAPVAPTEQPPAQPTQGGPMLALPAPDRGVIEVGADGTARTPAYQTPGYVGDAAVTDVVPKMVDPVREQVAAAAEKGGPLSGAALIAIDTGAAQTMQPVVPDAPPVAPISLKEADARDQAAYEQHWERREGAGGNQAAPGQGQVALRQPENFTGTPSATMGKQGATARPGPAFGLKDALAQIRAQKQEAANAQATAPQAAPASAPVPAAGTGAVEAAGVKPAGQQQLSADEQAAQDREEARAKELSLPPVLSARLQEAHKAHGRDVKRSVVERSIANEKANNTGTPKAKRERADRIARLEADLALFDEAAAMPPKEAAGPASIPATIGANSEPTPPQAIQASPQPAQAAAPAAAAGLTDGAPTANTGAQAATAAGQKTQEIDNAQSSTAKALIRLAGMKGSRLIADDGRGRKLFEVKVTPEFRNRHFVNGRMPMVDGLELKEKSSVTGNAYDDGYILIDNREQLAARRAAAPAPGPQAAAQAAQTGVAPRPKNWRTSMLGAAPVAKAMGIDTKGKRLAQVVAEIDARDTQAPATPAPAPTPGPTRLGRDNTPLSEGGKPFKTRKAAGDAKKLQPMMRVVTVPGGYALAEKTPAQLAAEERASRRLRNPNTSARGEPIPAHAFIAAAGGLNRVAASDMGVDGNPRIGNRTLFAGQGRGLSMDQATQMLIQDGYLSEGATINDALALIKKSLTQPQYNADGIERIAEAEAQAQFDDYLAAQEEAAADGDTDPFGMADEFTAEELDEVGYTDADPALQAEVSALIAQAEAMDIDTFAILEDIARTYANATQDQYNAAARDALTQAIARSNQDGSSTAAQAAPAAEPAAEQGLNQPEAPANQAQVATEAVAPEALELAAQTPAEAAARQAAQEQADKAEAAAKRAEDAAAKAEEERKRIAQASVRAADRFELGQDPMDSLTGQGGLMFSRTGAQSSNAQQPTTRAWYDRFVSLLPASYRNDSHRREPFPAEDWNVQRASEVRSKVEALNKQLRGADDRKGYGPVSVDGLGNLQVDARSVSAADLSGPIRALADELGAGVAATNVRSGDVRALLGEGFVSETSLAAIADRLMGRPFAQPVNTYAKDFAPGAILTYKPRGFPAALFSRSAAPHADSMFNGKEMANAPMPANAAPDAAATAQPLRTPAATIRAAITKAYGKLLGQLESKGLVTLTQTEDEAIEAAAQARAAKTGGDVEAIKRSMINAMQGEADLDVKRSANGAIQGFFDPQTGQSFLIADNLTAEAAPGVLMHEVGIHMAADGSMKALFNRAAMMLKLQRGNPFMKAVQDRMDAAGETSGEEAAAYIAEAYENDRANAPASVQRWLADLLAAVKAWMFKKGIMGADRLTVADIAAVARANAKTLARGQQGVVVKRAMAAFSRGTNEAMTNNDVVGNQGGRSADDISPGASFDAQAAFEKHGGTGDIDESTDITAKSQAFADMAEAEGYTVIGRGDKYVTIKKSFGQDADGYAKTAIIKVRISNHSNVNRGNHFGETDINIAPDDGYSRDTFADALRKIQSAYVNDDLDTVIPSEPTASGLSDAANPDIRFSRTASPSQPAAWDAPTPTGFDDVIYKLQDKNIDLKRVVEAITKSVGQVSDSINAYLKEELFHKRAAKRVEDFGARELKPLMNQMRLAGLSMEDVEEYLHARHAKEANAVLAERNPSQAMINTGRAKAAQEVTALAAKLDAATDKTQRSILQKALTNATKELNRWNVVVPYKGTEESRLMLSGMSDKAADNYFAKLDPTQRRKLESVAAKVDAIIADTRKLYVDYGLEDQAVVDGWANMYQHYIPLMREDKDGGMGIGQGFSVKGRETKGRTGSTRKVVDILANIASQRERLIVRGEKNRVTQALVGLAQANPNPDFWEVRSQAPTERVVDEATNTVVERPDPLFKSRDNVVVAKVKDANGNVTEQMVVFNEDNPRAVRMAAAMKNLDAGNLEGLLGMSAKITRYFSAINTQYNPVFGVVNLVRDVQGAMVNLAATPLAGQQGKIARDTVSALAGIYSDIRKTRKGGQASSKWAQLWEQMQDDGGTTGYRELFTTSADRASNLKSILNPQGWMDNKWGKFFTANGQLKVPMSIAQKGATEIFGWLSDYNEAMENGVRLAAYKAALDKGMSREQAASLAKNLTVNFNRKGQVGMQAGAVYAFFNAAMQGTARIGQTLFDMDGGDISTLRLSKTGKAVVYGGVTLGVMQALALAGAGFDEEDPPEFVRERSLIIPTGWTGIGPEKGYFSIPMPLGLHVIPGIGRHATEFALSGFDKPAKRALSVIGMFADAFNPIGNAGLSMQTLAPTALDPLVALTENKDWTGKPIARVSFNKALPGHTQWKDTATWYSKMAAEAINWVSGGNEYVAGALSPTPDQIDYLVAQVGGGVAREASKVFQAASTTVNGEELPAYKIPLLGRFAGNAASQASQGTAFYANLDRLNALETEIKGLRKDGRFDEAAKLVRENPQATMIAMANRAERDVQKLRRDKRELIAKDASREEVRAKEDQITAVMMRLNEAAERRKAN